MNTASNARIAANFGFFALLALSTALAQVDPSVNRWVNEPDTWSNPLKVCSTDGYQAGTFCFPYGAAYACGVAINVIAGTEVELSDSFGVGGASLGASATVSFSQALSQTAGR